MIFVRSRQQLLETGALVLVLVALVAPARALAQAAKMPSSGRLGAWLALIAPLAGPVEDRLRIAQLLDSTRRTAGFLLRSPSSLTPPITGGAARVPRMAIVPPAFSIVHNSAL